MMKFNTKMGTAVVPLLARLVLCAAFLTMGWNKLINDHTFRGDDAQILVELGVAEMPASVGAVGQPAAFTQFANVPRPDDANDAGDNDTERDDPNETDDEEDPRDRVRDVVDDVQEEVEEAVEGVIEDVAPPRRGTVTRDPETGELLVIAKRMHTVTLIVHKHDGPNPVVMGWLATLTELVGGALLLVGLFSRVWGLGLAITMVVAFYVTSWPVLAETGLFAIAADMTGGYADFNRMYAQLGLFVLAFGVFLTGAGPVSLDRWLFRPSSPPKIDDDE